MIKRALHTIQRYRFRHLNIRLIIYVLILCTIGINVIGSAGGKEFQSRQLMGLIVSICIMAVIAFIDYRFILKFYWIYYAINILLLLGVKLFGSTNGGAKRWIELPGFQLQPSEWTKLFLILFFAKLLGKYKDRINNLKFLAILLVLLAVPAYFIYDQPDLSTTIVIVLTYCAIIYLSGLNYKIIGGIVAIIVPIVIILIYLVMQPNQKILKDYQYNRIIGFYDENNEDAAKIRYQQENSVLAIGSGGLYGKGLNNNDITSVKNGDYLSEAHTDFIFTIVGEELGFVGSLSVILLLALIVFECFLTGSRAPDLSGKLICCGLGALIGFQSIINLSVVTMLVPNTGLTLPFVSYGLNSLFGLFACLGTVLNVSLQYKRNYDEEELL